ncbi:ceramidase-domain-containing protein [Podospora aff. communis PSN243]|uniref:Ceramidase-domain-containing protein n=1 Tax=Podospora aff. communis PSN243 TaxID=3040156 RepID=A0AAV9H263_9PEZI|nr:ceramidase-domain-containing protein [Podospora aff. communis PSN243]
MSLASALQIPYREARTGFWGEQTSTLNWCEEDYNITYYCAEAVNTATNLVFMWLGFKGLQNVISYSHDSAFILAFLGYIVVGLGSMAFHASLKYSMQLADELPMIYTVCIMSYIAFSYGKSPKVKASIAVALVGIACFISVYYLYAKDPVFHQVAYGLLTLSSTIRGFYVTEVDVKSALRKRVPEEVDQRMHQIRTLAVSGIVMFLAGFFIWNMDNIFCHHLVHARNQIQLPWSVVLEGHGWWHILTGLAYHLILWRVWVNTCLNGKEQEFMLDWTPLRSIPQVLVREIESQAIAAQQQIGLVRTQLASKQREMRLAQLTRAEISALPPDTPIYEGVGKMFVSLPVPALQDKLGNQMKDMETEVESLGKRLHYLETTAKNSQEHIEKMLGGRS